MRIKQLTMIVTTTIILLVSCNKPYREVQLNLVTSQRINGKVIALLDNKTQPVLLSKNRLIICTNRDLTKELVSFVLKGNVIEYKYQYLQIDHKYSILFTITTKTNNGYYYLSTFGIVSKEDINYSENGTLKPTDIVKLFEIKLGNDYHIVGSYFNYNINDLIWVTQSESYNKLYFYCSSGVLISSYNFYKPTKLAMYYDYVCDEDSFFGFDGKDIIFYQSSNNTLKMIKTITTNSNSTIANVCLEPACDIDLYRFHFSRWFVSIFDGVAIYIIDIAKKDVVRIFEDSNVTIGPSYLYYFTPSGVYYLDYDFDKNMQPINIRYKKLFDNNYKLVWYYNSYSIDKTYEMYFVRNNNEDTSIIFVTRYDESNKLLSKFYEEYTVINRFLAIDNIIPFTLSSKRYIYTSNSVYSIY